MNFSGVYSVLMEGTSVSSAITLIEITAASDTPVVVLRAWLGQDTSETSEQSVVDIHTKSAAGTGTAFTPRKLAPRYAASGASAAVNLTGEGTVTESLVRESWNFLSGWLWVPQPEDRIIAAGSDILGLRLTTAPAGATTFTAGVIFGEIG